ncbi:hypothetical protein ACMGD3_13005 [Lysinibacillus sphaericus]
MEDLQQELLSGLESYVKKVQPLEAFHALQNGQLPTICRCHSVY